jgi:transcriptional regulator with PAS, ATPase and Fis domain
LEAFMEPIRSVLWIGNAASLPADLLSDLPTLDVLWEPDRLAAVDLHPGRFDAVVLDVDDPDRALIGVHDLVEADVRARILVRLPDASDRCTRELERAGARAVHDPCGEDAHALLDAIRGVATRHPSPTLAEAPEIEGLVGSSAALREVRLWVQRAAGCQATVLVTGETGTGKERIARAIHERSRRADGPFVALNCAALPDTLLEAELLGHVRGAFTGAERDRPGLVEEADGGTLFLDEVAEGAPAFQAKLLRVLQERRVRPLGGREERGVDVRVVAATHRDLRSEVAAGRFRQDLYYRLAVLPIPVPPLRERSGDLAELVAHLVARIAAHEARPLPRISDCALRRLEAHTWPGNVRELENELQRALALAPPGETLVAAHLSPDLASALEPIDRALESAAPGEPLRATLDRVERWLLRRALEAHDNRRADTAKSLGVTREGLYKKMKRLGIE